MQKWHINYLEGQMSTLTPTTLLTQADTKIQTQQYAGLWQEPIPTPIMALQSQLGSSDSKAVKLLEQLTEKFDTACQAATPDR